MLQVTPIPALKDNYIWLIISRSTQNCLIVDPGEAALVLQAISLFHLKPTAILLTHHHWDHTGGVAEILNYYKIPVFGSIPQSLRDNETLAFQELNLSFNALAIPGHTQGHFAYYGEGLLFCGDTLFTGGCGRVFEGTIEQLFASLARLSALPDSTLIYCGHEYTENNLRFAQLIEPENESLAERINLTRRLRHHGIPTVPSNLGLEKRTNPFLRCHEPAVIRAAAAYGAAKDPIAVFHTLRKLKDEFS